jgi:hypothetical protein
VLVPTVMMLESPTSLMPSERYDCPQWHKLKNFSHSTEFDVLTEKIFCDAPKAEEKIFNSKMNHEYAGITGVPEFNQVSAELIFGNEHGVLKDKRVRWDLHFTHRLWTVY